MTIIIVSIAFWVVAGMLLDKIIANIKHKYRGEYIKAQLRWQKQKMERGVRRQAKRSKRGIDYCLTELIFEGSPKNLPDILPNDFFTLIQYADGTCQIWQNETDYRVYRVEVTPHDVAGKGKLYLEEANNRSEKHVLELVASATSLRSVEEIAKAAGTLEY